MHVLCRDAHDDELTCQHRLCQLSSGRRSMRQLDDMRFKRLPVDLMFISRVAVFSVPGKRSCSTPPPRPAGQHHQIFIQQSEASPRREAAPAAHADDLKTAHCEKLSLSLSIRTMRQIHGRHSRRPALTRTLPIGRQALISPVLGQRPGKVLAQSDRYGKPTEPWPQGGCG